ncbi:hypothetical protein ACY2DA_11825 [Staphylococcus simulans]
MKKFKLVFKGTSSERKFLEKKKAEGYYLTGVINGVYTFKHNPDVKDTQLQTHFVETKHLKHEQNIEENSPFFAFTTKKLDLSKYTIIYSYLKDKDNPIYNSTDTKLIENHYLKHLQNILLGITMAIMFICLGLWMYMIQQNYENATIALPLKFMSPILFFSLVLALILSYRIRRTCPTHVDEIYLSYSISIQTKDGKPDIQPLQHLGAWRFVTEKNGKYYYNLYSKQPKEVLTNTLSKTLNIQSDHIFVYSQWDLFPVYMHF